MLNILAFSSPQYMILYIAVVFLDMALSGKFSNARLVYSFARVSFGLLVIYGINQLLQGGAI